MLSLTKVRFVARLTLSAAVGVGCGGQGASDGTGTAAGGAAVGSGGALQVGASGSSSSTGGATGMSGASGGQTSAVGASGGTLATGVAGAGAAGAPMSGGLSGSGGTLAAGGSSGSGGMAVASGGASAGGSNAGASGNAGASSSGGTNGADVSVTITPGSVWKDTQGNVIQAHGEGIIKVGTTYYWLGEDKANGSAFQNVKCYSSNDLAHWTFVDNVLTRQASGDLGPNRVIERPHVIYNAATSQFVMYMHVDNSSYTDRKAGVATSSSVCGSYTYLGSVKPLGHDSLDDNLFQDGTSGYFLSEDRSNTKLQIYRLSADYLTVSSLVATVAQYEAPALAKIGGTYLLFGSHLSGWATNDNQYTTATSISGPWAAWKSFAPTGTNTCNSQSTFVLPVAGSSGTAYVFLADRWNSNNLSDSRYVWLPLTISGTAVSTTCATSWKIDSFTGTWSP